GRSGRRRNFYFRYEVLGEEGSGARCLPHHRGWFWRGQDHTRLHRESTGFGDPGKGGGVCARLAHYCESYSTLPDRRYAYTQDMAGELPTAGSISEYLYESIGPDG